MISQILKFLASPKTLASKYLQNEISFFFKSKAHSLQIKCSSMGKYNLLVEVTFKGSTERKASSKETSLKY